MRTPGAQGWSGRAWRRVRRGFTLLEVLIGILILALAVLGLGAVIPVVVRSQRAATDATLGVVAANGAVAMLKSNAGLNRLHPPGLGGPNNRTGWGVWLLNPDWSPAPAPLGPGPNADAYLWEPPESVELDPLTGELRLEYTASDPFIPVVIPLRERLWPQRGAGVDPQYVWDFAARRAPRAAGEPDKLQVALFIRPIDRGIRLPSGLNTAAVPPRPWTLFEVLTNDPLLPAGTARLPVAVDPGTGFPTNNGVGEYALLITIDVSWDSNRRDRLLVTDGTANEVLLAQQPGQKLVDNLGNVYIVTGVDPADAASGTPAMLIDPPIPGWVPLPNTPPIEHQLREVVFSPVIPARVTVFTLTVQDPK